MPSPPTVTNTATSPLGIQYLDTTEAYDLWADVYDTDGNFLQKFDTLEMATLLPEFLSQITTSKPWRLVDLGCGTGRNTVTLLRVPDCDVVGLDASPKMLDVARSRLQSPSEDTATPQRLFLGVYDILQDTQVPSKTRDADGVISTLVLEHLPLKSFFHAASSMLKIGGLLLVTNMHSDMGQLSQAGFVDAKTGFKIRPRSYAHTVIDTLNTAEQHGFEAIDQVREQSVAENMVGGLGRRSKKWIGVAVWFGVIFRKVR